MNIATLNFEPLVPSSLWTTLAVAGAALLLWYAMRRPGVVSPRRWVGVLALMACTLMLVLLVLLNPTWVEPIPQPAGKPALTILLDQSASMATADGADGASRYDQARQMAGALSRKLAAQFDVRVRTFSDTVLPTSAEELASRKAEGKATDLAAAIASAVNEDRPQGQAVVLLSDGIQTVPGGVLPVLQAVQSAEAMAAPVYAQTFGTAAVGMDLGVVLRSSQDLAFVAQKVPVVVQVTYAGLSNGRANVSLWHAGQEVARQGVDLTGASPAAVQFEVGQEKTGVYAYQVRVEGLPGEITQANNAASYLLRVVDQPIHVLLIEGKPYWDSKFLMRTLASVPAVQLDSLVRIKEGRLVRRTLARAESSTRPTTRGADVAAAGRSSSQPSQADRQVSWQIASMADNVLNDAKVLKGYQVIVLGRDTESFLNDAALTNLQAWISRDGGALVCYRGAPAAQINDRLGKLLPVKWTPMRETRFRMRLTDQGREMHWLPGEQGGGDSGTGGAGGEAQGFTGLPTLASTAQLDHSKPLAVVLATTASLGATGADAASPAVVYQPYGGGRVVVIEGAGMWRWAFLAPQYQQQEEVYGELWQSLLNWLASGSGLLPGQTMALRSDSISFGMGDSATATLLVREELRKGQMPAIELIGADGKTIKSVVPAALGEEPGTYRADFGKLAEGQYEARIAGVPADDASCRTAFDVRGVGEEQLNLKARPDLMQRIASDSGGAVLVTAGAGDAADQVVKQFKEHQERSRAVRMQRVTAWDRWWIMAAVLGVWGMCWVVRRFGGLV